MFNFALGSFRGLSAVILAHSSRGGALTAAGRALLVGGMAAASSAPAPAASGGIAAEDMAVPVVLVQGSAACTGPAFKRARMSVMTSGDDEEPAAVWQVCAAPASKCGRLGASWIDLPEPWASQIEVMFQSIKAIGEVWQVVSAFYALGPEALPKVTDSLSEVIFIHGGDIVMRCFASGTERAVRRLEYVYGARVGAVVLVEVVG